MAIESISSSSDSAGAYRTTDVSIQASHTDFTTKTEPAQKMDDRTDSAQYAYANTENGEDQSRPGNKPSENTIKQAVSDINKKINPNTIAEYGYHEKTNRVTIKIVDKDTDKVIKEFPAEETLDMIAKVWELAGMFLDEKG